MPLPAVEEMEGGEAYVLLLRILNADGLPVSEEQQVRFKWLEGGGESVTGCYSPALSD